MGDIGRFIVYWMVLPLVLLLCIHAAKSEEAWQASGLPPATEAQETQIFQGCAFKAELIFYAAQQKLYAQGNVNKLLAYLKEEMSEAEYQINESFMRWVGEWVDGKDYDTAHEYSAQLFAECVSNSYQHFQATPTEHAEFMMRLFYEQLDAAEERLLPMDTEGEVSA